MFKKVIYTINMMLNSFNYRLSKIDFNYEKRLRLHKKILFTHARMECNSIGAIIFSMDRAIQLDALLRSFFLNKIGVCKVVVIYRTSTREHEIAYNEVVEIFKNDVEFIQERGEGFKSLVLDTMDNLNTDKVFFLVDDIIFTHRIDFNELIKIDTNKFIFSLRLGEHLNHSYVVNKTQKLPKFIKKDENYIYWDWDKSELDWAYPLSVDGHIFNRLEIKSLIEFCEFLAPNSLENSLQSEKELFSYKTGVSYKKARIVNNPCNKVQNEVKNIHGSLHQDHLLSMWNEGKQIDINVLQGYVNKSVHEDIQFEFEDKR
jgi:hypothetical protein